MIVFVILGGFTLWAFFTMAADHQGAAVAFVTLAFLTYKWIEGHPLSETDPRERYRAKVMRRNERRRRHRHQP